MNVIYRATLAVVAWLLLVPAALATEKPNFVVIFIDDMGYGDITPFGSKLNQTPALERMAAAGMKLTSFYAAPVCSASRAQLLTGCYAPRVSVPGVFFPAGSQGLNPAETTVAEYLRECGYATMCVGKWHLGDQPEFLPTNHGFDGYFGVPYSNDMQRNSAVDGRKVLPLLRDAKVAELLEDEGQRRLTKEYTEEAVKFIESNQDGPFFLYLPHTAMHVPLFPHQDFVGKSDNGVYGDWIAEVDWSVGQILATLKRLEIDDDTLVLFTSDNGPWASRGKAGGVSGPLRGSKGCTLEGGVREPTIAMWPGKIAAGTSSDVVMGTTDILPTLVSLAGGKLNAETKLDGVDVSRVLLGESTTTTREAWFYFQGSKLQAVRSGPWKLAITPQTLGMGIRERPDDLRSTSPRLYNLDQEIGEVTDLAAEHPEVVARLQKLAAEMAADIGGAGRRPAGRVENPVTLYPTQQRRRRPAANKPVGKVDWKTLKLGQLVPASHAPAIAGQPFTVTCTLTPKGKANGMVLAHGGSAVGYTLYVADDKIWFALRTSGDAIHRASVAAPQAQCTVRATVTRKELTLTVGEANQVVATSGLIGRRPQEGFGLGKDDQNPVDEKAPTAPFGGSVTDVSVRCDKPAK